MARVLNEQEKANVSGIANEAADMVHRKDAEDVNLPGKLSPEETYKIFNTDAKREAAFVIRNYRKLRREVKKFETKRPTLLRNIGFDPDAPFYMPSPDILQYVTDKDMKALSRYLESKMRVYLMDLIVREELEDSDAEVISDICENGLTAKQAAERHGIAEVTVRGIRKRAKNAYAGAKNMMFYGQHIYVEIVPNKTHRDTGNGFVLCRIDDLPK